MPGIKKWQYTKGLHEIGNGIYAYLQPDGGWGWSNAGLITGDDSNTLVDTLYDLQLTHEMYKTMQQQVTSHLSIGNIINTHSDGDHTNGNQLFPEATIIASKSTAEEMRHAVPPQVMADMLKKAPPQAPIRKRLGAFDFNGISQRFPTETFDREKNIVVGEKQVRLLEVGPAHTLGDTLAYLPKEKVIFTGDIVFAEAHPVVWAGPISNWITACNTILALDIDVVVPGHGPITDLSAVEKLKNYFLYIFDEASKRYQAGMSALDAAYEINYDMFASWKNSERMIPNVMAVYRDLSTTPEPENVHTIFAWMDQWEQRHQEG
ncbi:hypothetical protein KDA_36630 [Dictyobacter alpinus]|uniref:Metallo-beta-lactamase domain-containing protein n=1 Tax=Dictyobacter alpinus TaxID=2014873 RepID=A0A402BA53_9CHLR|nr:MBL fold metallo-hydrolase [Dictyobacter alpinus]GCE28179.1 hypothetical protein KDA_36630 [Dictyobacter alpinus]